MVKKIGMHTAYPYSSVFNFQSYYITLFDFLPVKIREKDLKNALSHMTFRSLAAFRGLMEMKKIFNQ